MTTLNIITDDWKIVPIDEFMFIAVLNNGEGEEESYILAGILDDELNFMALFSSDSPPQIMQKFNMIAHALDAQKPVVDLREPDLPNLITIISSGNQRPGSENN
jgi:hypothetical protein